MMASEYLKELILKKDLSRLDEYLSNGRSVNGFYEDGTTPLFLSIYSNECEDGSSVPSKKIGISRVADEITLRLIRAGADVNGRFYDSFYDCEGTTLLKALFYRKRSEVIEELLYAGSNVNAIGYYKSSPLTLAVQLDYDKELIYKLIQMGADVNHKHGGSFSAFNYAVKCNDNYEIGKMLVDAGAQLNEDSWCDCDFIFHCLGNCDEVNCKNKKIMDYIVSKGFDLTMRDTSDNTTIIHVVECIYLIGFAIRCGVSVESKDSEGSTPLIYSFTNSFSHFSKIKSLLELFDADPNNSDNGLKTVLHYQQKHYRKNYEYELILYHGGDIFAEDVDKITPLDLMVDNYSFSKCAPFVRYYLFYIDENNLYEYFRKRNSNISEERFESTLVDCKKELCDLKLTDIKVNLTFYQFCHLKRYYKDKPIEMSVDELKYNFKQIKAMFPIHHDFIIMRMKDNIIKNNRKRLLDSLERIIIEPLPCINENDEHIVSLNYDCLYLIAYNFSRNQLYSLFQASIND